MIRHEKLCEGNLSTSLLEGSEGSDAALSDCENRTVADMKLTGLVLVKNVSKKRKTGLEVLGLILFPFQKSWQVRMADQAMYHQGNQSVFVGGRLWTLLPPPAK